MYGKRPVSAAMFGSIFVVEPSLRPQLTVQPAFDI
jgi:hypothetical protein